MSDPRPQPEQRVREFLAAFLLVWGDDQVIDSVPAANPKYWHDLNPTDLTEVLNELDSWRAAAERAGVTA